MRISQLFPVLVFLSASLSASFLAAQTMSMPISADSAVAYANSKGIETVEEFLAALPASLQDSYVLVNDSLSLQKATPDRPRQILFGADARFIVAAGSVADDPRRDELEFAEFDEARGIYHFGTISFAASHGVSVAHDVPLCLTCHSNPARPIWGQYPDWRGVYSDEQGSIKAADQAGFKAFLADAKSDPRYAHLHFADATNDSTFKLPSRFYAYPNTVFNHELGNTIALGVVTRFFATPESGKLAALILASSPALDCFDSDSWTDIANEVRKRYAAKLAADPVFAKQYASESTQPRPYVEAYRLGGIDPDRDLSLEAFPGARIDKTMGEWLTGAYRLEEAVSFQLLAKLEGTDKLLHDAVVPQQPTIDELARYMALTGDARATALKESGAWFYFWEVFDPIAKNKAQLNKICSKLFQNAQ